MPILGLLFGVVTACARPLIHAALLADEMGNIGMQIFLLDIHDNLNFNNCITWLKGFRNILFLLFEMFPAKIKQLRPAFLLLPTAISRDQLLCTLTRKAPLKLTFPDELKGALPFVHPFALPLA
jgi:hypothetical protein